MPSCEMAVVILAVLGLSDLVTSTRAKRLFTTSTIFMVLAVLLLAYDARSLNSGVVMTHTTHVVFIGLGLLPFIALGFFSPGPFHHGPRDARC